MQPRRSARPSQGVSEQISPYHSARRNLLATGLFHLAEQQIAKLTQDAGFMVPRPKNTNLIEVAKWFKEYMHLDLEMLQSWPLMNELRLVANTVKVTGCDDVAIATREQRSSTNGACSHSRRRHIKTRGRPKSPEALAAHDCIQYMDPQRGKPFEWEFRRAEKMLPVNTAGRLTLADVDTMIAACVAGGGIAQVLALSVEPLVANGTLVDLFPDWPGETFPLFAIRPSRRLPPAKVEAFLDFCTEVCRRVARSSAS